MDKPECKLTETDGNVFAIIGNVSKALKRAGMHKEAREWQERATTASSYDEVLRLVFDYVEVN